MVNLNYRDGLSLGMEYPIILRNELYIKFMWREREREGDIKIRRFLSRLERDAAFNVN